MGVCPECKVNTFSIQRLEFHLKWKHRILVSNGFHAYSCYNENCSREFLNWKSYREHLIRSHKVPISISDSNIPSEEPPRKLCKLTENSENVSNEASTSFSSEESFDNLSTQDCLEKIGSPVPTYNSFKETVKETSNNFLKEMYSNKSIPRNFVQKIVTEVSELVSSNVSIVKREIDSHLREAGVPSQVCVNIDKCLSIIEYPFRGLSTDYLRLKHFRSSPKWVEPEDLVIGDAEDLTASKVIPVEVKMSYIPLAKSLKACLESPGVFHAILEYMASLDSEPTDCVSNFIQSELWKSKVKNKSGIHIPLFKFYDDYNVNNSLGPHADSGKLGGVYCSIPVLPPKIRSLVDNIFVVLLFKSHDRELFSNDVVFHKIIEELEDLQENGITICVDNVSHVVHFRLGLVIGDNLGVNSMFDFVSCFTANHSCRFCKIHRDALHFCSVEDPSLLRNVNNYSVDVLTNDVSVTGIQKNSVWNSLPGFHVTENPSVDIMHDLLQGVCHYDMAHVIQRLIKKKYFSLDDLNFHLGSHNYGCLTGENKPTSIREENLKELHFKMSASEMLSFVRNFSVMMGHCVPQNDPVWYFYLLLRRILDIVLCPVVTPSLCDLLDSLVEEHNDLYFVLFRDTLKPKHHNLIHYSRIMRLIGPLVHVWCMRFECKNRSQTVAAQGTRSRKNIMKTLTIRESITQVTKDNNIFSPDVVFGCLKHCDVLDKSSDFLNFIPCLPFVGNCMCTTSVVYNGIEYKVGSYISIGTKDDGALPLFGKICYIVVHSNEEFRFLVHSYDTQYFCDHFHAYVISHNEFAYKCVNVQDLIHHHIFTGNFNGSMYVSSRFLV